MRGPDHFVLDGGLLARFQSELEAPKEVAIVGAGRWGRVLCDVLTRFSPALSAIHLVAERSYCATKRWLDEIGLRPEMSRYERVVVRPSLREVLESGQVEVAFVTNMTSEHYAAARELLLAGKHVLVEKPFVLSVNEAEDLVRLAKKRKRALVVGYEFMFARTLHHFREVIARYLTDIRDVRFIWEDCQGVEKWGARKQPDLSNNVVIDLYPHVLSQLLVLFGRQSVELRSLTSPDGCWRAGIDLLYGSTPVTLSLDKEASAPRRLIAVTSSAGASLELDYTREPGTLTLDGRLLPQDRLEGAFPKSLTSEIAYFFAQTKRPERDTPNTAEKTLHIIEATVRANSRLVEKQTQSLRRWLWGELPHTVPDCARKILRHQMVAGLLKHGLITNPKDPRALDGWVDRCFRIVQRFSRDPWTTQESVLEQESLDPPQLIRLNAALRDSGFLQNLMVGEGLAHKYWTTILPLIETGSIHAVMTQTYKFPLRVGVYPAVSCMFYCSFCGRVPGVKYPHGLVSQGNETLNQVFADMGKTGVSTLSLGGGLEPLTNPNIDGLIRGAKRHGVKVPLVTNGYMMTPKYVKAHEGLWDLDVLRVSLYGVDDDSYYRVTKRLAAFPLVKSNIIEFLKERNRRKSEVKLGLNFIVLVNTTDQVLKVLDVIRDINAAVGDGEGVDFLTLREDFSVPETEGLTPEERARLVDIFKEFTVRQQRECPHLQVDFGYALHALSEGVAGKPLAMVTHQGMFPRAYPQVSVAIDLLGDVYLYRDAAFLDRPGADRYIIGRVTATRSLEQVVRDFLESGREIQPLPADPELMDAFDHVVTKVIWQAKADEKIGIPFNLGPVRGRLYHPEGAAEGSPAPRVNYWERLRSAPAEAGSAES